MGKTLYLECESGISGDMTVAALLDLGADQKVLREALASLPVQGFDIRISRVKKSGLDACDFDVVLDTEHENCSVNLTGISDDDYSEYMEVLNQEGFSVIENVSEEIEEGNYVSIGTLLSNEDKWLSISYIPDSLTIYISFDNN